MAEQIQNNGRGSNVDAPAAIPIHTRKITDSCRDKDCIEDLRVYLTRGSQNLLDSAAGVRVRSAELLYTYIDVEPVAFDRNHYCIDVTFYYRILADATIGVARPASLYGLAVFTKRAVLCGEDGRAHIYRSDSLVREEEGLRRSIANRPTAIVEVLDPMVLSSKVRDICDCGKEDVAIRFPEVICGAFDDELVLGGERRRLYVTLGQFSIIRLERDVQLLVHVLDYAIPVKECCDTPGCTEDPCEVFSRIPFPAQQFTPTNCDNDHGYPCDRDKDGYRTCGGQT